MSGEDARRFCPAENWPGDDERQDPVSYRANVVFQVAGFVALVITDITAYPVERAPKTSFVVETADCISSIVL